MKCVDFLIFTIIIVFDVSDEWKMIEDVWVKLRTKGILFKL